MKEKVRLIEIDKRQTGLLKGISILLIMIMHAGYIFTFGSAGVALFLIVSAYGLCESEKKQGLTLFWNKRLKAVYIPYLMVAILNVAASFPCSKGQIAATLLGLDFGRNLDGTMWYISFIFFWYAAFYISTVSCRVFKEKRVSSVVRLIILAAAGIVNYELCKKGVWPENRGANVYICFFPIGVLLNMLSEVKVKKETYSLIWTLLFAVSSVYMFRRYVDFFDFPVTFAGSIQILSLILIADPVGKLEKALSFFGKYSFPMYLFEGLMLYRRNYWFGSLEIKIVIDLVYIAVTTAIAYIFWEYVYLKLRDKIPLDRIIRF